METATYKESVEYMEREFARAEALEPDYVLLHYPKPVILDDDGDWSSWWFSDDTEYYYESEMPYDYFADRSRHFFKLLSEHGVKYGFTPVLELDALNRYIYDTNLLEGLLDEYPNIRVCLDFGRMHVQDSTDEHFDGIQIVRKFARYTHLVHLWNVNVGAEEPIGHYPALESLKTEDGWGDMAPYFSELNKVNDSYKVLFEHKSHLISDLELEACYEWVGGLVSG